MDNNNITHRIKALWIDDEPTESFVVLAKRRGIDLKVAETVKEGMDMLDNKSNIFEAIILDANCKIEDKNEQSNISALSHAIAGIYARHIDIPWFVYTAGGYERFEMIETIIPQQYRNWDTNAFYTKPIAGEDLFAAIKKAVENSEVTKALRKYKTELAVYGESDLVTLLVAQNKLNFSTDHNIPNSIRKIADTLCYILRNKGFVDIDLNTSNVLGDVSKYLGFDKTNIYIPKHIQGAFHYLSGYYCNPGSHGFDPAKPRSICNYIQNNQAPYANITGLNCLLDVIRWIGSLDLDNEEFIKEVQIHFSHLQNNKKKQ